MQIKPVRVKKKTRAEIDTLTSRHFRLILSLCLSLISLWPHIALSSSHTETFKRPNLFIRHRRHSFPPFPKTFLVCVLMAPKVRRNIGRCINCYHFLLTISFSADSALFFSLSSQCGMNAKRLCWKNEDLSFLKERGKEMASGARSSYET